MTLPLAHITSLARSGALDRAWAMFVQGGFAEQTMDAAALAVKGRLLKDKGLNATGVQRRDFLTQAQSAYATANGFAPQPWLLINVATLAALTDKWDDAADLAGDVLARLGQGNIAETPYYIEATRAEALLLIGDIAGAANAMRSAIAYYPDGWADHASTLRQLGLILKARGQCSAWLDPFRPPKSLHFAGHLGILPDSYAAGVLAEATDILIQQENIGFGYGALAAGADIVIAEVLLAAGVEMHVSLSTSVDAFCQQSVMPLGGVWVPRYHALIDAAASIYCATNLIGEHEPLATILAGEVAMGAAAHNAKMIESTALQLLVTDETGGGANTARQGQIWLGSGRQQIHQIIAREFTPEAAVLPPDRKHPTRRLAAMLQIDLIGAQEVPENSMGMLIDDVMQPLGDIIAQSGAVAAMSNTTGWLLAYRDAESAVRAAAALKTQFAEINLPALCFDSLGLRICGHYALVHIVRDPVTGNMLLRGGEIALLNKAAEVISVGSITVTEPFASAIFASGYRSCRTEIVGDPVIGSDGSAVQLYALMLVNDVG